MWHACLLTPASLAALGWKIGEVGGNPMKMPSLPVRRAAAAVAMLVLVPAGGAIAGRAIATDTASAAQVDVPVAGTFSYHVSQDAQQPLVHGAIHAVRRLPGATAVYYSVGFAEADQPSWFGMSPPVGLADDYGPYDVYSVSVVDTTGLKYYQPMVADGKCLCSQTVDFDAPAGTLVSGFAILPELPADLRTVSVDFGYGAQVEDVQVGDGALTPQSTGGRSTALLGAGWPMLPDAARIAAVPDPARYARSLVRSVTDTERTVTTKERPGKVDVALAADVLFAVDKSALSPAAQAKLAQVAADITKRGTGLVTVIGSTDSTGATSRNLALSKARAQSVLAALQPRVRKPGVRFTSSGLGESDPVADNGTPEGRKLNRRVTISYQVGGAR